MKDSEKVNYWKKIEECRKISETKECGRLVSNSKDLKSENILTFDTKLSGKVVE